MFLRGNHILAPGDSLDIIAQVGDTFGVMRGKAQISRIEKRPRLSQVEPMRVLEYWVARHAGHHRLYNPGPAPVHITITRSDMLRRHAQ